MNAYLNVTTEIAGGGGFLMAVNRPADIECDNPLGMAAPFAPSRLCMPENRFNILHIEWNFNGLNGFDHSTYLADEMY